MLALFVCEERLIIHIFFVTYITFFCSNQRYYHHSASRFPGKKHAKRAFSRTLMKATNPQPCGNQSPLGELRFDSNRCVDSTDRRSLLLSPWSPWSLVFMDKNPTGRWTIGQKRYHIMSIHYIGIYRSISRNFCHFNLALLVFCFLRGGILIRAADTVDDCLKSGKRCQLWEFRIGKSPMVEGDD